MKLSEKLLTDKRMKTKSIDLFFDIETFQFNEKAGYLHPSQFKNDTFSVAVSFWVGDTIHISHYANFIDFLDEIESVGLPVATKVNLYAHNGNKYDNHYLLMQLIREYPDIKHYSKYNRQALVNKNTETFKTLNKRKGDMIILEKRVKSKSSVALEFTLGSCIYRTVDTYPKFNLSLRAIGDKMLRLNIINEDELKTDFDYLRHNRQEDLEPSTARLVGYRIFNNLTESELKYIDNDVILLAKAWRYFDNILPKFDRDKITFSQNVMEEYKINPLATFQLTGKYKRYNVNYSDFVMNDENYADYLKHFYKGGLNIYNDKYVGKLITDKIYSYDLNSSYPNVMYNSKIPTYLLEVREEEETITPVVSDDYFEMYEITIDEFNNLLTHIPSIMIRKALVKYYANLNYAVYINSNTIELMNNFANKPITKLHVKTYQKWQCEYFGGRDVIADNYFIKTQGKNKHVINMKTPSDIEITDKPNTVVYSAEEIANSKVTLNGIYGLPALRPFYNLFLYNPEMKIIESFPNSFKNSERNQIFSIYVTSRAFVNLLAPMINLSPKEIDDYWYYADTDSLYMDARVDDKIDKHLFNNYNLGYFKKEHTIDKMYILNHKKYAFVDSGKINIRSGGVNQSQFNLNQPFEQFIETQFSVGVTVPSTKSVLTNLGTLAIYNSSIKLDVGNHYPTKMYHEQVQILNKIADNAKNDIIDSSDDAIFIDTPFGVLSVSEVLRTTQDSEINLPVDNLVNQFKLINYSLGGVK